MLLLFLFVAFANAQLFTCNDTVTVCLIGVETCCCQQPLTVACQCCEPIALCVNGTCMSPSPSATQSLSATPSPSVTQSISATPSPSATQSISATPSPSLPPCSKLTADTLTCRAILDNITLVVPGTVGLIAGDLFLTNTTTLVLNRSVVVLDGVAVVAGTVQFYLADRPDANEFVPIISVATDNNSRLQVSAEVALAVSGPGVPTDDRECARYTQHEAIGNGGRSFGVVFQLDETDCAPSRTHSKKKQWIYRILLPVVSSCTLILACAVVLSAAAATALCWYRIQPMLWPPDDGARDDAIIASK